MYSEILATVLMPVYNVQKYLKESIESILNQTFCDFKFLIIDDGSTDNTSEIINSFSDSRIKYVKLPKNGGIVEALNKGLELIDTKYILRFDADDIAPAERFKIQIDFMENNPEIGVSSGHFELFGGETGIWKVPLTHNQIKASLVFQAALAHPAVIIRTSVLRENNLKYEKVPHMEDYDLWYRMKNLTKFQNLDITLVKYRRGEHSVTAKNNDTVIYRKKNFYKKILNDLNIDATEEELLLHCGLSNITLIPTPENIRKYKNWLLKLETQNKILKTFPEQELKEVIIEKWDQLFWILPKYGLWSVLEYRKLYGKLGLKKLEYFLKVFIKKRILKIS